MEPQVIRDAVVDAFMAFNMLASNQGVKVMVIAFDPKTLNYCEMHSPHSEQHLVHVLEKWMAHHYKTT